MEDKQSFADINITRHAKERYAQRIMDKETTLDINNFICTNEEKIAKDIQTMLEYGTELFSGKSIYDNPKNHNLTYYVNGLWVVVVDTQDKKVVTLYKIDLGLGDDFNKEAVARYIEQINLAKEQAAVELKQMDEELSNYREIVSSNQLMINSYRAKIKALEETNEGYNKVIGAAPERRKQIEDGIWTVVARMMGRRDC